MNYDIDFIIGLMEKHTFKPKSKEIGEQDSGAAAGGGGASGGKGYPTVTKWETGIVRGPANQVGVTKWKDMVKINRGKANTLL